MNIDALRQHLVDMDNVFVRAGVTGVPVSGGARYEVTSADPGVQRSILGMARAHARMVASESGRQVVVDAIPNGASMTVTGQQASAEARIRALGFFGLLTDGSHHQRHHLMIAKGQLRH